MRKSKASRACLTFNVGRVLRDRKYLTRVSPLAAAVLAATIEVKL